MNSSNVEADFQRTVSAQVRLVRESEDRFRVLTPFVLEDGDHLSIILKREDGKWILSDEGHTYMQLSYDLTDGHVFADGRGEKIREALGFFSLSDREGEIIREVENSNFGEALYAFVQGLIRIAEVSVSLRKAEQTIESESSIVAKERKELSLPRFRAAFRELISEAAGPVRFPGFNWHDPERDPGAKYTVDCRLEARTSPLFVFMLPGNERTRDATIALHQFHEWGLRYQPVGIFRNAERITPRVKERLVDVCPKIFPRFDQNREQIAGYLREAVQE